VRLFASGICHSQLHQMHTPSHPTPALLGHEATGVVEAGGAEGQHVREGDRVMVTWVPRNPEYTANRPQPATATWRGKQAVSQNVYTWAEDLLCDQAFVVPLSNDVPVDVTAIIGCAVIT